MKVAKGMLYHVRDLRVHGKPMQRLGEGSERAVGDMWGRNSPNRNVERGPRSYPTDVLAGVPLGEPPVS